MDIWLDHLANDYAQPLIVILAALAAIGGAGLWGYRKVLRPTIATIDAIQEIVAYQLQPNGGSSLVDRFKKMERNLATGQVADAKFQANILHRLSKVEAATCPYVVIPDDAIAEEQ